MNNKTKAIVITVVVALLCACLPLCAGVVGFVDYFIEDFDITGLWDNNLLFGGVAICVGLLGVIAAVVVGIVMLRKKPEETVLPTDESLPPTI